MRSFNLVTAIAAGVMAAGGSHAAHLYHSDTVFRSKHSKRPRRFVGDAPPGTHGAKSRRKKRKAEKLARRKNRKHKK